MNEPFQVRTDLAIEAKDMYVESKTTDEKEIKGVTTKEREIDNIKVSYVDIDDNGAKILGKKAGSSVTIYADDVKKQDTLKPEQPAKILAIELVQ